TTGSPARPSAPSRGPSPSPDPKTKAAGGVLTAKRAPHRPGTAPALGLRAARAVVFLSQTTPRGDDRETVQPPAGRIARRPLGAQHLRGFRPGQPRPRPIPE